MARFWNGYQWREADEQPKPELQPEPEPEPVRDTLYSRSLKSTRRPHVHTFVNDVCECGERED